MASPPRSPPRELAGFGADVVRVEGTGRRPAAHRRRGDLPGRRQAPGRRRAASTCGPSCWPPTSWSRRARRAGSSASAWHPADLRAAKPSLVITSISPFGQTGPYRDYKATNIVTFAMGGFMTLTGAYDREPLVSGGSQAEYFGGLHAFAATPPPTSAPCCHGEGDWIDLSLQECAAGTVELYGAATAYGGPVHAPHGQPDPRRVGHLPVRRRLRRHLHAAAPGAEPVQGHGRSRADRRAVCSTRCTGSSTPRSWRPRSTPFTLQHTMAEMIDIGRTYKVPIGVAVTPADLLDVGQPGRARLLGRDPDRRRHGQGAGPAVLRVSAGGTSSACTSRARTRAPSSRNGWRDRQHEAATARRHPCGRPHHDVGRPVRHQAPRRDGRRGDQGRVAAGPGTTSARCCPSPAWPTRGTAPSTSTSTTATRSRSSSTWPTQRGRDAFLQGRRASATS